MKTGLVFLVCLNFDYFKSMKKATFAGVILILFSFSMMAQSGFRPGFIIRNNGDTLNGLVFYGANRKFEKSCLFKRFEIAQEVSYSSDQIKAYGFINGRDFESKTNGRKKTFFECLVKGEVSVYIVPGKYKGMVYLESPQTGLFKLAKGSNQLGEAGNFNNYRDALSWMLNKTGNQALSLDNLKYDSKDITAAVRESSSLAQNASRGFYRTPGVNNLRDKSVFKQGSLLSLGFSGGYQIVSVTTPGNSYTQYFTEAQYNTSFRPAIGLYMNSKFSKKSNLVSVDLAVHYVTDSYYGYSEYSDGNEKFREDIMIDFSEIQVPLSLHMTFGKGSIHPFIKAGGFMSFLIDQSYSRLSETQRGESVYTDYYEDFRLDNAIGFIAGAGVQFKIGKARLFGLEAVYSKGSQTLTNLNSSEATDLNTSVVSIMARINL
jgi:hypothetical protein